MAIFSLSDENASVYHQVLEQLAAGDDEALLDWRYATESFGPRGAKRVLHVLNQMMLAARADERARLYADIAARRELDASARGAPSAPLHGNYSVGRPPPPPPPPPSKG